MKATEKRRRLSRSYELTLSARMCAFESGTSKSFTDVLASIARFVEYQTLTHYFGNPPSWRILLRRLGGRRTLPDFAVVGPIKGGSSDLGVALMLHPNVMAPLSKEFFLPDPTQWILQYPTERQKRRHARRFGSALSPFLAPYLHWMELAHSLAGLNPRMKVVIVLRDPVERFYSHWKWELLLTGRERANALPFLSTFPAYVDCALTMFPEVPMYTACGFQPLQQSIYWKAVRCWFEAFGVENVMVCDINNYFRDRSEFLFRIHRFVGLPCKDISPFEEVVNQNPLQLPASDLYSNTRLHQFFSPHNARLWDLIGEDFGW